MVLYEYDNPESPSIGGHSTHFSAWQRNMGRSTAIAATRRVLSREPHEATGDNAFDLRTSAFRSLLESGLVECFEENPRAFKLVGL
jgi:hypothetical protein